MDYLVNEKILIADEYYRNYEYYKAFSVINPLICKHIRSERLLNIQMFHLLITKSQLYIDFMRANNQYS